MSAPTLLPMLQQMGDAWAALGSPYTSHALVAREGRAWIAQALPKDIKRGTPKECFRNALTLVMRDPNLRYVEGYALRRGIGIPIHHAWAVDKAGRVIDNTWTDPEECEYVGMVFSAEALQNLEYYGTALDAAVIDDYQQQQDNQREEAYES